MAEMKIRVVYKSGYYHDTWVKNFTFTPGHIDDIWSANWVPVDSNDSPIFLGKKNIESIWQLEVRNVDEWN